DAEQRVRKTLRVAGDQLGIVEIVAGIHLDVLVQPPAHVDLALLVEQRDFDAIDLGHVGIDDGHGRVHRLLEICRAPVARQRWISSSEVGQSSPMPRCAVSIASATPRPRSQTCSRNAMVRSQSIAALSQGSLSARGSATTWAAENATRLSVPSSFAGNVRDAARR